ncbi:hypothetical protein NMG60_11005903 [Bertholletia excelsa]
MGDSFEDNKLNDSPAVELTGKIMVGTIIILFLILVLVLFLHLYAKWFCLPRNDSDTAAARRRRRRRRRFDFAPGYQEMATAATCRRGLDRSVLKSIPVVIIHPKDCKEGLECAVCLSDIAAGEKARFLPKCNHGFHVDCIDMWFQSHSTCPLCRNPILTQSPAASESIFQPQRSETSPAEFPTNVLVWGDESWVRNSGSRLYLEEDCEVSTSSEPPSSSSSSAACSSSSSAACSSSSSAACSSSSSSSVVIDVPRGIAGDEEAKSPVMSRLTSFKRLFSWERRVNPSSPNVEAEQPV